MASKTVSDVPKDITASPLERSTPKIVRPYQSLLYVRSGLLNTFLVLDFPSTILGRDRGTYGESVKLNNVEGLSPVNGAMIQRGSNPNLSTHHRPIVPTTRPGSISTVPSFSARADGFEDCEAV